LREELLGDAVGHHLVEDALRVTKFVAKMNANAYAMISQVLPLQESVKKLRFQRNAAA